MVEYSSMAEVPKPLVSVIIPTYNEERDITRTLNALANLRYRPIEIIVVDASTDRTREVVWSYADRLPGLQVLDQGPRRGVSTARNVGLRAAHGEIVVVLNADVFPEPDFLDRVIAHYQAGADYVLVESRVANTEHLFPRYIQAMHAAFDPVSEATWTEGFSCRREAILAVGGFPEEFGHNTAGEDDILGERLQKRFRRAADPTIVVPHVAPESLREYWRQRLGRGRGGAYRLYAFDQRPLRWGAVIRSVLGTWLLALTLVSPALFAGRLVRHSPCGRRDWLPLMAARMIEMLAVGAGYWNGCREVARLGLNKA
jgi:glycosyltransferase involved in cell wall biosynthesis